MSNPAENLLTFAIHRQTVTASRMTFTEQTIEPRRQFGDSCRSGSRGQSPRCRRWRAGLSELAVASTDAKFN